MYSRIIKHPLNKSFYLFGPRGTGKTTWVKATFPDAVFIDLLESELFIGLLANPQRLEMYIPRDFDNWIIIDEIQKIPELLNEVHRLIEKYKYKFILIGSSARKIKRKGFNLLAGRALTYSMHPLTATELGKTFDLEYLLNYGGLPSVYAGNEAKKYLASYVKTYLQEEIQFEGLTRNLGAFSRFLEAASFSQGSVLNISAVARDCAVERKVVENYFSILEDLLIAYRIPVFSERAKRRMIAHPKFYFFDAGVYRTIRPMGPLDRPEEVEGIAYETLVFQELKAINSYLESGYEIFYWRTADDMEVDFVLYGGKGILAFEVKRTAKVSREMTRGLRAFLKAYPMAKTCLIYGGERRLRDDNIEIMPIKEFLLSLPTLLS
jgi:predicted AAA+ superfamily ATPase